MIKNLLYIYIVLLIPGYSFAQGCGKTFKEIDLNCINQNSGKFSTEEKKEEKRKLKLDGLAEKKDISDKDRKTIELQRNQVFVIPEKEEDQKKLHNTVFFYTTSSGNFGKFNILNIRRTPRMCSIYVESTTYTNKSKIDKTMTFQIKSENSSWNTDMGSFDENGGTDFVLLRQHGECVLKKKNGNIFQYKKLVVIEEENSDIIIYYASLFLIGLAVFLIVRTVFQDEDKFKAQEKLEDADQEDKKVVPNDIVLKYSRPFFKRYVSPVVQGMKNKKAIREKYKRSLASSGMNQYLTPEDFYAFKISLIVGFPVVYMAARAFLEEDWPLSIIPLVSVFGFFYPDIWIKGKIEQRRQEILRAMPFVVDMLALIAQVSDWAAGIQKVIEKAPRSALVDEFEIFVKETRIGASRAEALRNLSWRIDALPVSSFCATLIAADSVGADIAPILKTLSVEMRQRRSAEAEKKGAAAATKILVPMIFLILPAVILIVMAPVGLQLAGG